MSTLADRIAALREAGAVEITVSRKGAVRGKFPPVVAVDPQQKAPPFVPVQPAVNPLPWQPFVPPAAPWTITVREPCLFDGLPPGIYGLVCSCPKCAPR